MPQIGFTDKQSSVFHRFNALRRAYEDANGGARIYNPDFLSVLMDAWEEQQAVYAAIQECREPVRLKDSDNRYINNATVATSNLFLTDQQSEAMVFDSPDEAKAFLQKWGRSDEGWIFEPVNELQ